MLLCYNLGRGKGKRGRGRWCNVHKIQVIILFFLIRRLYKAKDQKIRL
jgi:hypothetical protein